MKKDWFLWGVLRRFVACCSNAWATSYSLFFSTDCFALPLRLFSQLRRVEIIVLPWQKPAQLHSCEIKKPIQTTNATSKTQGAVDEWSKTQLKGEKKVNSDIHCLPSPLHYGPGVCTANGVQQVLFLCDKSSISPAPFPDFGYYLYLRSTTACHNLHWKV